MTPTAASLRRLARAGILQLEVARVQRPAYRPNPAVVILQPDHLGDVILSQPAIQLLRDAFPRHRLVGIVGTWSVEVAAMAWPVDAAATLDFHGYDRSRSGAPGKSLRSIDSAAGVIHELRPELVVVLRPDDLFSVAAATAAGAPRIVTGNESTFEPFHACVASTSMYRHRTAKALTIASVAINRDIGKISWESFPLRRLSVPSYSDARSGRHVVVHPGSGVVVKHWLPHRWRAVIQHLERSGLEVTVTGGKAEIDLCRSIADGTSARVLAGETNLQRLAALFQSASLAVGTDNGPMHFAVAMNTPTIGLYGPSDPNEFGPWGDPARHRVLHAGMSCPRCTDLLLRRAEGCGCMVALTTECVTRTIDEMLAAHADYQPGD